MSRAGAFLLGALGGLLPILVSILAVDLAPIIDHPEALSFGNYVGYAIRVLVLIFLGGTMALLNNEVKQPFAIVQLGIAAPALVTSFINGSTVKPSTQHASFSIISIAHAEDSVLQTGRVRVAGGILADVTAGFGTRLDGLAAQNRANQTIEGQSSPVGAPPLQGAPGGNVPVQGPSPAPGGQQAGVFTQMVPAGSIPPVPQGYSNFCITPAGRIPGTAALIGSPCTVMSVAGPVYGFVGQ